jgi:hypothetical protein
MMQGRFTDTGPRLVLCLLALAAAGGAARAHQSLLAGNREAGYRTLEYHLDHPQMRHWYAFDEGGKSGSGGWPHLRTKWNGRVAMPHGWAVAEVYLLLRDCLAYENNQQLVLFAGVSPGWFTDWRGMRIRNLPTWFGKLDVFWKFTGWKPTDRGIIGRSATLRLAGDAAPPKGFVLVLPNFSPQVSIDGKEVQMTRRGFVLPAGTKEVEIQFRP